MTGFRLPRDDEHTAVVGRNGSGKTQLGSWLLSKRNLKRKPWVIIDYKGDELLNSINDTREIGFNEIPKENGLYILHGRPDLQEDMEKWLWKVWEKEGIGLYVDEGYMLPQDDRGPFQTLLTQGRSKRIPIITLSQRPVKVNRFVFSEASHIAVFHLNDNRDVATVTEIVPRDFVHFVPPELGNKLPPFWSRWYALKEDARFILRPVPQAEKIKADIEAQLEPKKRWL